MKMAKNSKHIVAMFVVVLVLCCAFGASIGIKSMTAFADADEELTAYQEAAALTDKQDGIDAQSNSGGFTLDSVRNKCQKMTNSDIIGEVNGITYTISMNPNEDKETQYTELIKFGVYKRNIEVLLNYMLIPEELFRNVGQWYYQGKEYTFWVDTVATDGGEFIYRSDVIIIDNVCEVYEDYALTRVGAYMYSGRYGTKLLLTGDGYTSYRIGDGSGDFYMANVYGHTTLASEHLLNKTGDGYDKNQDRAPVIKKQSLDYGCFYTYSTSRVSTHSIRA